MRDFGLNKIFVEGKSDKCFIEALLSKYFDIDCDRPEWKGIVVSTEGKDKLRNQPDLNNQERKQLQSKNLIVFDADFIGKGGGFERRKKEYKDLANELGLNFRIFLLPDNENEGELENLIKTCFKQEFSFFDDCWSGMIKCFEQNRRLDLNLPNIDGYIYSYADLLKGHKQLEYDAKKTEINFLDEGLWNLDKINNPMLRRLVDFIENNFFAV